MAFAFRRQPLKAIYILATALSTLFIRLPYWTLRYLLPQTRPRRSWSLGQCLKVEIMRIFVNGMYNTSFMSTEPPEKVAAGAQDVGFVWVDDAPELVVGEIKQIAEVNGVSPQRTAGFWYGQRGSDGQIGQAAGQNEKVVYFMFGGGFVMGTAHPSSPGKVLIDTILEFFPHHPRLFALEYRTASASPFKPANHFPAALIDALAGYKYLVQTLGFKPENIIISGLSSGGQLAFWLARYLAINQLPQLSNAGGLVLFSPTADWANTRMGPDSSMQRNPDFVYTIMGSGYTLRALMGNLDISEAKSNAWIAPASAALQTKGLFTGIPKTCILVGSAEQLHDAIATLRDRLVEDLGNDNIKYVECPDATHDLSMNRSTEMFDAMHEIAAWIEQDIWLN